MSDLFADLDAAELGDARAAHFAAERAVHALLRDQILGEEAA